MPEERFSLIAGFDEQYYIRVHCIFIPIRPALAEILLKYHADPTVRCDNKSLLEYVAKHGNNEMKKLFEPFSVS